MGTAAGQRVVERVSICDPDSPVAAWFMRLPDGQTRLTINAAVTSGASRTEHVERWWRLNGVVVGRPFAVLTTADVVRSEGLFAGHTREPATAP